VPGGRAFVFWRDGKPAGLRARTLREFAAAVEQMPAAGLEGHLRRGDFSRWIADVFGDYPLAKIVAAIEDDHRSGRREAVPRIVEVIRLRYQFVDPVLGSRG
jgi:hypothetical protein